MNVKKALLQIALLMVLIISCSEKSSEPVAQSGKLIFKGTKYISAAKSVIGKSNSVVHPSNPNGVIMHTLNLKLNVAEIWVSQDEFTDGGSDNLKWYKIGENNQMKLFDEYSFTADNLPVGIYKSIKIKIKLLFYRIATYQNDKTKTVELLERNGSWIGQCNDFEAFAPTNYFNSNGNFNLSNNKFISVNRGEKLTGFEIKSGKVTNLYWKLGDERDYDPFGCSFEWIDENKNGVWDCGIDRLDNFNCNLNPPLETMWIFIPKYE